MKFVRVQLALNYADLNKIDPAPNCVLRGEYYIQLLQDTVNLGNAAGNAYCLPTFNGNSDLHTLSMEDVKRDILGTTHQDAPYDLLKPVFNLTSCRTDSKVIYGELKSQVVHLALPTIHQQLFKVLVPGYTLEPHNVLDHIWQSYIDADGTQVRLTARLLHYLFKCCLVILRP